MEDESRFPFNPKLVRGFTRSPSSMQGGALRYRPQAHSPACVRRTCVRRIGMRKWAYGESLGSNMRADGSLRGCGALVPIQSGAPRSARCTPHRVLVHMLAACHTRQNWRNQASTRWYRNERGRRAHGRRAQAHCELTRSGSGQRTRVCAACQSVLPLRQHPAPSRAAGPARHTLGGRRWHEHARASSADAQGVLRRRKRDFATRFTY